jgi:Sap-like sulfolipid-1-addressing protein
MTVIVFVTHREAVRVSLAFLIGVAVAASLGTTIAYLLADRIELGDASDRGSSGKIIQFVLVGLLLLPAIRTYLNRDRYRQAAQVVGEPPGGESVERADDGSAPDRRDPTDIASMLTVGVNLAHNGDSLLAAVPFLALTLLIAALPLLTYLLFGRRAREAMPRVRDWMTANSWLVNIIVLAIFIVLILS